MTYDCGGDTLTITCHYCGKVTGRRRVEHNENLPPSVAIRWHERMAAHIRKHHQGKPITKERLEEILDG